MSDQYLRKAELFVAGSDRAIDLSEMQFRFSTTAADAETPNTLSVRVYNLSDKTATRLMDRKEYSRVTLQAGYQNGAYGQIFDGTIKQTRRGKETAIDSFVDIFAADADEAYNFGIVNQSIPAGVTTEEVVNRVVKQAWSPYGVTTGAIDLSGGPTSTNGGVTPRGKVAFGLGRDMIRNIAVTSRATWSIQNGKLQMIPITTYLHGEAVVLNAASGMVGFPEQTDQGVTVRCLLNPKIVIAARVHINNKDIQRAQLPLAFSGASQALFGFATTAADGFYRVMVAEHSGDTRGNEWYTDLICLALDPSAPIAHAGPLFPGQPESANQ